MTSKCLPFQNSFFEEPHNPLLHFPHPKGRRQGQGPAHSPSSQSSQGTLFYFIGMLCWHKLLEGRVPRNFTCCPSTNAGLASNPRSFCGMSQRIQNALGSRLMDLHRGCGEVLHHIIVIGNVGSCQKLLLTPRVESLLFFLMAVMESEPRTLCMLRTCSTTECTLLLNHDF